MKKIFIDGSAGTTGLRIFERISSREDISLIKLPEEKRKDSAARKIALNEADIAILCLPDAASIEAVSMIENENTVVLDTSTAHRTATGWTYGFPELSDDISKEILSSKRIAVPGCHAGGYIALVYPLVEAGVIAKGTELSCFSLTGYSGGGKSMIADYTAEPKNESLKAPRQYALAQAHKHLPEMATITGTLKPVFCPVVGDFYSGMQVTVPLCASSMAKNVGIADIIDIYKKKYTGPIVSYADTAENGFLSATALSGKDSMHICVYGNDERMILTAVYDNLGKGASGAAVECLNMVMGVDKTTGLCL